MFDLVLNEWITPTWILYLQWNLEIGVILIQSVCGVFYEDISPTWRSIAILGIISASSSSSSDLHIDRRPERRWEIRQRKYLKADHVQVGWTAVLDTIQSSMFEKAAKVKPSVKWQFYALYSEYSIPANLTNCPPKHHFRCVKRRATVSLWCACVCDPIASIYLAFS